MNKPNIIYIHSHDTGRYVQPYGYAVPTPNLQNLAEHGVLFRQAFSAAPTCSPSRAALVTGQSAHSAGMFGLALKGRNFNIRDCNQHIIHTLKPAGYTSALIGVQHIALDADTIGYDEILEPTGWPDAEKAADAAVNYLGRKHNQPFFLAIGTHETHRHNFGKGGGHFQSDGNPAGDSRYVNPPAPLPDTPETRLDMADFIESAKRFDSALGRVLEALESNKLADNTLVICTTDHGLAFPGMKCTLTDHGIGVMLIMRGPGGFTGGRVIDSLVSQIDLFPTLCDLAGADHPHWLEGKSLLPLLEDQENPMKNQWGGRLARLTEETQQEINDSVFAEVNYHTAYEPMRAVRTTRWKYIRRFDDRHSPILPHCDPGPSKDLLLRHGWRDQRVETEQLFDLVFDPQESNNLAGNFAHSDILNNMRARLNRWMQDTKDPLLTGPAPTPANVGLNDPDGIHHTEPLITQNAK